MEATSDFFSPCHGVTVSFPGRKPRKSPHEGKRSMAILDHWHPVLLSSQLKKNAVASVCLAGHDLALYRNSNGEIGALTDHCPHRRMKLSLGKVYHDKLQCAYHGWTFDATGNGESPATP